MDVQAAYGPTLAKAFRLDHAPALVTRALRRACLAVTEVRCDRKGFGRTSPIPREDAWLVALQVRPCPEHELWHDGQPVAVTPIVGGETMIYDLRRNPVAYMKSAFHSLHFYLPRTALDALADEAGAPRIGELDYVPGERMDDHVVRALARAVSPALAHPEQVNLAFAEHLLLALAAHVAGTYGHMQLGARMPRGGLAPWQLRRATEMMLADLAASIPLSALARECGLSVSHFTRAFRQSTGLPPHRWLLRRRVEKAQELLHDTSLSLAEIALSCGFADQSHFTRVFTSLVGRSPGTTRRLQKT